MGLMNRIFGGGDDEEEVLEEAIEDTWEEDEDWEKMEDEEDEEEEIKEWDSAYDFLDDALNNNGFAGMQEFMNKAMVHKINSSVKYRDRVKVGQETMTMVSDTVEATREMGGGDSTSDWGEAAERLAEANEFKEQIDKMVDKEEMYINQMMNLADEGLDVLRDRVSSTEGGPSSGVETSIREEDREL